MDRKGQGDVRRLEKRGRLTKHQETFSRHEEGDRRTGREGVERGRSGT